MPNTECTPAYPQHAPSFVHTTVRVCKWSGIPAACKLTGVHTLMHPCSYDRTCSCTHCATPLTHTKVLCAHSQAHAFSLSSTLLWLWLHTTHTHTHTAVAAHTHNHRCSYTTHTCIAVAAHGCSCTHMHSCSCTHTHTQVKTNKQQQG